MDKVDFVQLKASISLSSRVVSDLFPFKFCDCEVLRGRSLLVAENFGNIIELGSVYLHVIIPRVL